VEPSFFKVLHSATCPQARRMCSLGPTIRGAGGRLAAENARSLVTATVEQHHRTHVSARANQPAELCFSFECRKRHYSGSLPCGFQSFETRGEWPVGT
jgi:hypothetical protein